MKIDLNGKVNCVENGNPIERNEATGKVCQSARAGWADENPVQRRVAPPNTPVKKPNRDAALETPTPPRP